MAESREAAMERERDFLLGSLTDLETEREAGDLDADDFVELRSHYVARAADTIRVLDGSVEASVRTERRWARVVLLGPGYRAVGNCRGGRVGRLLGQSRGQRSDHRQYS